MIINDLEMIKVAKVVINQLLSNYYKNIVNDRNGGRGNYRLGEDKAYKIERKIKQKEYGSVAWLYTLFPNAGKI